MTRLLARLKPRWGIASVLTLSVVCVIALLITLITALDIRREKDIYRDGLEQRGLLLASGLNDLLANSLYFSKVSSLEEVANAVSSHPDVRYVQVLGPDGRLLVTPEGRGRAVGDANHVFGLSAFHSPDPLLRFSGNRLDVAGPVKIGTKTVGVIQFGIESGALGARIREIVFQHIWQGLVLMVLGVILSYLIAQRFVRPIKHLVAATQKVGEGEFQFSASTRRKDEIGDLSGALGEMTFKLGEHSKAMKAANQQLHMEIAERKRVELELEEARDGAIRASRIKSEFLANMSHEIRTPMNAFIGMNDLLLETQLDSEQQEYVRVAKTAGDTLLTLINDILDLSKVEAGKVKLESAELDLEDLVENTAQFFARRAHEKGIELSCHISPDVPTALIGDPLYLRQVITNLVSNAIKFTEKGEVVVQIRNDPDANEPGALLFRVSDTGMGMPQDKLNTVFDSFTQIESSLTREYGGTGLGLSISRKLVELMGGRIWVESEVGKGTTFYFSVRLGVQAEPNGHAALPLEDMQRMKTLIVDDNATNRMVVGDILASWGAPATEVADGYEALVEIVRARREGNPYQLLLLDRHMPGQDGFQVARSIKKDLGIDDVNIIMLTSDARSEDPALCEELGISHHLIKPIKRSELLQAITTSMGIMKVEAEEQAPSKQPAATPEDQRALHLLLVDDSPDNRLLIRAYLKSTSHQIDMAENGEIAVEKFRYGHYDLVLMDVQMPVMDGYTATRTIRKWENERGLRATPIIGLTAYALKEDEQKSAEAGCSAHITKPIKKATLMEVISEHTRRRVAV